MFKKSSLVSLLALLILSPLSYANKVSALADKTAEYAVATYANDMVDSLSKLVRYETVAQEGIASNDNPVHIAFKAELKKQASALGFDFIDHGYIFIIGLGDSKERVGIITHGDVMPATLSKWTKSPFELDTTSQPGKLIARGTEDDKGAISTALYAMKAIKDKNIVLKKRLELYVYMAEESDWGPLETFVKNNVLPQTNITIDASYPVVSAEKGFGTIKIAFDKHTDSFDEAYLSLFEGGFFGSQIPEDAKAVIQHGDAKLLKALQKKAASYKTDITFTFDLQKNALTVTALGKSAHSSEPADGTNAISYLADLLNEVRWRNNGAGTLVNFLNDNIGLGLEGKKFGEIAYQDDFMGPMTVAPTVIKQHDNNIELNINIRRPRGKTDQQLRSEITAAITAWNIRNLSAIRELDHYIDAAFVQTSAPHIDTLLSVFSKYTGIEDAKPISIGGGTNSRLFPNAVSFGPSMPNTKYTGHTEHEFISMEQFELNLKMYTAVMVELAK